MLFLLILTLLFITNSTGSWHTLFVYSASFSDLILSWFRIAMSVCLFCGLVVSLLLSKDVLLHKNRMISRLAVGPEPLIEKY